MSLFVRIFLVLQFFALSPLLVTSAWLWRSNAHEHLLISVVIFFLGLALASVLASYWIARRLTTPINELIEAAKRAARNDFSSTVPESGWGEIKLLIHNFNVMMFTLHIYQEMQVERVLEEKAKVDALVHTIPDGIVLAGFDGKILYMNVAARSLLGEEGSPTSPKAKMIQDVLREPRLQEMAQVLLQRKKRTASAQIEIKRSGGGGLFLCRAVTVLQEQKEVGILLLLRDVTPERALERMKEEFFHSIVHDLRSPLSTIDGFIQLMIEQDKLDDMGRIHVGYIQGSLHRLRRLVSDILDTAKIQAGQMLLKPAPMNAKELFERMRVLYMLQAERLGVNLRFDGETESAGFQCDRNLIERVIMNLIGNALKFTPKGGTIIFGARPLTIDGSAWIELFVSDTGPGIPLDKLEAIFEKFKQLDGPLERSGYGLGLFICKKIVELHGGRIWADSEPGHGTRFALQLPAAPPASSCVRPA